MKIIKADTHKANLKIKADTHKANLKIKADSNNEIKYLLVALAAQRIDSEQWRGWVDVNGAKVKFNPKTRMFFYAAKVEDNSNKYLFDHLASVLAKKSGVRRDKVTVDRKTGSQLDIFMGGSTKYYCASWKLSKTEAEKLAAKFIQIPDETMLLLKQIESKTDEKK